MAPLSSLFTLLSLITAISALPTVSLKRDLTLQKRGTYTEVFSGSGTDPGDTDASVSGWGYLTFTRLDTYDLTACESWCDGISACAFVNLYYEYNTDATYNPQIKCVAYAVPHTAADKTNWGGQQLLPPPAGMSYMQDSVGYTSDAFANPTTPDGFSLVFGPIDDANEADGLLESHSLTFYDTQGCADLCNAIGSSCVYFNIWLGVDGGSPTYTCAMYSITTDASTATNTGQDGIQVTNSRGYTRIIVISHANLISDGGFEDNNDCISHTGGCYGLPDGPWQDNFGGSTLVQNTNNGQDGEAWVLIDYPAFLSYTPTLDTVPGHTYLISIAAADFGFTDAELNIYWNGVVVSTNVITGSVTWATYTVQVTAVGNDVFAVSPGPDGNGVGVDDVSITAV